MSITAAPKSPEALKQYVRDVSDLSTVEACDSAITLLTNNFMYGMARVLYAYVYRYKHGTFAEFCDHYGKSKRSGQRYEQVLRDLHIIEAAPAR